MTPWKSPFDLLVSAQGAQDSQPPDGSEQVRMDTVLGRPMTGGDQAATVGAFQRPGQVIGTPAIDGCGFGQQGFSDTCAIRCQEFIIEQFTGVDVDERALVEQALEHGWYVPGQGTSIEHVGNLLELHGIAVERYTEANIFQLAQELAQGHKIIVGVDGAELLSDCPLWEEFKDWLGFEDANHAILVTGIDTRDPDQLRVILNDPGTGEAGRSYPLDQFVNAWRDSRFTMVATRDPVPPHAPEMEHFDYQQGLFDRVARALGFPVPRPDEMASFVALDEAPLSPSLDLHCLDGQGEIGPFLDGGGLDSLE